MHEQQDAHGHLLQILDIYGAQLVPWHFDQPEWTGVRGEDVVDQRAIAAHSVLVVDWFEYLLHTQWRPVIVMTNFSASPVEIEDPDGLPAIDYCHMPIPHQLRMCDQFAHLV